MPLKTAGGIRLPCSALRQEGAGAVSCEPMITESCMKCVFLLSCKILRTIGESLSIDCVSLCELGVGRKENQREGRKGRRAGPRSTKTQTPLHFAELLPLQQRG